MAKQLRILSLGAGVQSSTLALMIEHGDIPMVDGAIFSDTGNEPKQVYEWLEYLKSRVSYPIYVVRHGNLKEDSLKEKFLKLPVFLKQNDNSISFGRRQCTREYKITPVQKKIRELLGLKKGQRAPKNTKVELLIGISKDEMVRVTRSRDWWIDNQYPLIFDKQFTRQNCLKWLEERQYPLPIKSACIFCPFHANADWLKIKNNQPEDWKECVEFDKDIRYLYQEYALKHNKGDKFKGVTAYLHRSCTPLDEAELDPHKDQMDMFNDICDEGMCGV